MSDDSCNIEDADGTDYFIRVILEVPILGCAEGFMSGVWISVCEDNFNKYVKNFSSDTYTDHYCGWFSNELPYYADTLSLKASACVASGGPRPQLELASSEHALGGDFSNGISWQRALEIAQTTVHASASAFNDLL